MSMRFIPADQIERAAACTAALKKSHGAPIWIGNPSDIGIDDIDEVNPAINHNYHYL